jgi:sRNA-binding protein
MAWKWRTLAREQWTEASELLDIVALRYPVLVARPAKPLAVGTGDRLKACGHELGLTEDQADLVMVRVTRTSSYLAALARGGHRYDLDGGIAGEVSAQDRKAAAAILAARRAKRARNEAAIARGSQGSDQPGGLVELSNADAGNASGSDDRAAA